MYIHKGKDQYWWKILMNNFYDMEVLFHTIFNRSGYVGTSVRYVYALTCATLIVSLPLSHTHIHMRAGHARTHRDT